MDERCSMMRSEICQAPGCTDRPTNKSPAERGTRLSTGLTYRDAAAYQSSTTSGISIDDHDVDDRL